MAAAVMSKNVSLFLLDHEKSSWSIAKSNMKDMIANKHHFDQL